MDEVDKNRTDSSERRETPYPKDRRMAGPPDFEISFPRGPEGQTAPGC